MTQMLTWRDALAQEKTLPYFQETLAFVARERAAGMTVYPPAKDVFNAFRFTELNAVKVVILGQDPYHGPNQAHGLSFSVKPGVPAPPSLVNIYKELASDIPGFVIPNHGCLQSWAQQGVMLLNTVLTVEAGKAHSHASLGWETFTDKVIKVLNAQREGIVFLLWGSHAQKKGTIIDPKRHHVLKAPHPSPLSAHRGFLGCRHFSRANALLEQQGQQPIDWTPTLPAA
ncbi:Uracil-DNA glycosylase [Sodalis glossinidius str. 'morsitans']|uniref:Uracil-DNA glycosylase n=2 Tax=Sodalis glossinidius (strain morsitans) TaxID=343509 RepID=UNG_SODGM|nr:uracil-DNA glycosylase [Sodalis glossinidius]Q2NS03.1 RecName: Full=Uracil-DNA glycosylase; Short=UDG [Sodalis glossinidius str. 'morsitans']BAE75072.1 uracil-DNA glycosylase [Sodalis glossinidius str. 'morsitans']CRL45984.1 Uracil-DNA glycosylase [Sodalis glossinidius str. 'morsitans']